MNKITAQVGQIIEVNGKQYRATESGFELITVNRGPLGGELRLIKQLKDGDLFYVLGNFIGKSRNRVADQSHYSVAFVDPFDYSEMIEYDDFDENVLVETNIPPRPTFTPMTAGEAAKLPDIVGRWVAVKAESVGDGEMSLEVAAAESGNYSWINANAQILLIEGADL